MRQQFEFPGFVTKTHIRCEDCDLRGDLDATGRPLGWARIRECKTCNGRGEIPLAGTSTIDPYAQQGPARKQYVVRKRWDSEAWPLPDLVELARHERIAREISTPPHGHNHGRTKTGGAWGGDGVTIFLGAWRPLETEGVDPPSVKRPLAPRVRETQRAHGMAWRYVKGKCRCELCREWNRDRMARYRTARVTTQKGEENKMQIASDTQLAQTVRTLEACQAVIGDCARLIASRFPEDERIEAAVEQLLRSATSEDFRPKDQTN